MLKDKIVFTICDDRNLPYALLLEKSFKHFHKDVPFKIYGQKDFENMNYGEIKGFFYKATPLFAKELIKEYSLVVKIDADSAITAPLDDVFNDTSYDLGVVLNNNRLEPAVTVFNVPPANYANCGFVAMRSRELVNHWWDTCNRYYFDHFQYREQDLLNIIINYGNYNCMCFDNFGKWYGLISKSEWNRFEMRNGKLICPADKAYNLEDKTICVIHAGGGNTEKWNWGQQFKPEVAEYLREVTK